MKSSALTKGPVLFDHGYMVLSIVVSTDLDPSTMTIYMSALWTSVCWILWEVLPS